MTPDPINWDRLQAIFGYPDPVSVVTERQFDCFDAELQRLARTPHDQINLDDLWYYHHDLAYVELQPQLFAHLFPVCLMDWHRTLLANQPCSHGDSEFHYGLVHGDVLTKMLSEQQRDLVEGVFFDSMRYRMDQERGFIYRESTTPAYGWLHRLNSLGLFCRSLPRLWESWWELQTCGRAVCLLQYCSGLMYFTFDNPVFKPWTEEDGGGGPYLWENDSMVYDRGWLDSNIHFLENFLTVEHVGRAVSQAAKVLQGEPEAAIAGQICHDFAGCRQLVASRIAELPSLLSAPNLGTHDWSC